jgi:hypothetical protein
MSQRLRGGLAVAGAAADARQTAGAARHATGAGELTAGATADTWHAALPARAATGTAELAAGTTVAVSVAAAATWVLLEHGMSGSGTSWARIGLGRRHRHHSNRCSNSSTNEERFEGVHFH